MKATTFSDTVLELALASGAAFVQGIRIKPIRNGMLLNSAPAETESARQMRPYVVLFFMPLFFSSNIVLGRAAIEMGAEPFTLAFLRWFLTGLVLLPFVWPALRDLDKALKGLMLPLAWMGFLGMWVCGALVYFALKYTSATNGTLIYTSSPVMIILIEWLFRGRQVGWREACGVAVALAGVVVIVTKGSAAALLALSFNLGDLIFVATAISWAIYSVGLKSQRFSNLPTLPLFTLIAFSGALLLAPFALVETIVLDTFPATPALWTCVAGIVVFASVVAFSAFQYGVGAIGPSLTGIFLYLLPVYGVSLAVLLLGERLALFHLWGILLVAGGVVLATFPNRRANPIAAGRGRSRAG